LSSSSRAYLAQPYFWYFKSLPSEIATKARSPRISATGGGRTKLHEDVSGSSVEYLWEGVTLSK